MKFKERIPNFVDTDRDPILFEGSIAEILDLPKLKQMTTDPNFVSFEYSPQLADSIWPGLLMVIYENRQKWYVVGYLSEAPAELPIWKAPPQKDDPKPVRKINLDPTAQKEIEAKMNARVKAEKK